MQKWQQKNRKRIHESIIQNAKPTINLNENLTKSRQKPLMTTSRSKQLRAYHHTKQENSFLPFVKILELLQLQKYSNVLIEHGFPHKLAQKKSTKFIDDILTKVDQQDQQRFLSLMNTLTIMSKDILKQTNTKNFVKNPLTRQKNVKSLHYPPQSNATNVHFRKSYNNLTTSKKSQKTALFKVRQTNNFKIPVAQMTQINLNSKYSLSHKSKSNDKIKDRKYVLQNPNATTNGRNSKTPKKRHRQAYDDAYITHTLRNSNESVPQKISKSNKIIQKLMQKLKKMNPQKYFMKRESAFDINLDLQKIKKMYLSFDSATLTSNIHNIDLEEIIDCFVEEVYRLIDQNVLTSRKNIKCFKRSERKKGIREPSCKYIEFDKKQQIEYLLKESLVFDQSQNEIFTKTFNPQSSAKKLKQTKEPISTQEFVCDDVQNDRQNAATKSVSISSNSQQSDFQVDYQIQSFVQDFGCFDSNLQHSMTKVQKSDIKNFIQLVIMAGKMEKQMPIIAYMYLKKLFKSKRLYRVKPKLTLNNWKNIILVTLISASKIWDDTSLENHSFSKVIKPYTTYEINRLEKYFLYYIDYQLTIDQRQYCQSYFQLRKNSVNANKTAHLMSLDVKTIKELENKKCGIKKKQTQLKDYYKNKMDKSF